MKLSAADHKECGCMRPINVGERFRRRLTNWETGETYWWNCTIEKVHSLTGVGMFCRRIELKGDDGRSCKVFASDFGNPNYQRIDNVISLKGR